MMITNWKNFINENVYNRKLEDKLLSIKNGIIKFGADTEEEIEFILNRGIVFENVFATKKKGEENRCHKNVSIFYSNALLKMKKSNWKIMNGYAFHDGVWVSHSWLINGDQISETVKTKFIVYYGYILTPEESEIFVDENL